MILLFIYDFEKSFILLQCSYQDYLKEINCHFEGFQYGYIYYKSFRIFIQFNFKKFMFINKFYIFNCGKSFCSNIQPSNKLFHAKLKVCVIKKNLKHFKNHFYAGIT